MQQENKGRTDEAILQEIHGKIAHLEEAICKLSQTTKSLSHNASEVTSKIQCSISRQLESLRSREVWLLKQVELIHSVKESEVRSQIEQLHRALGQLQNCLQCMEDDDGLVAKTVADRLEKLNSLNIDMDLAAPITFTVDDPAMRQAIHKFGRINNLYLNMGFAEESQGASSLPPHYEDYGDAQHHVFYKSLEDTSGGQHTVNVNLPKLSPLPQDWLYLPSSGQLPMPDSKTTPTCEFPPFQRSLSDFMKKEPATDHVEQWLHQIKGHTEMEDEDFEIVGPSISPGFSMPVQSDRQSDLDSMSIEFLPTPTSSHTQPPQTKELSYTDTTHTIETIFNQIQNAPMSEWLLKKTVLKATADAVNHVTMKYFRETSSDIKDWLYQKQDQKSDSCTSSKCTPTRGRSFDIENLDQIMCCQDGPIQPKDAPPVLPKDTKQWLVDNSHDEDADVDETPYMYNICKANEPCESLDECVCEGRCGEGRQGDGWLMSRSGRDTCEGDVRITEPWVDRVTESLVSREGDAEWLLSSKSVKFSSSPVENSTSSLENSNSMPPAFKHFSKLSESGMNEWLNTNCASENDVPDVKLFPPFETTEISQNQWLIRQDKNLKPTTEVRSEYFKGFPQTEGVWLKNPEEKQPIAFEKLNFTENTEKEGNWLMKSTNDQSYRREIKSANEKDANKWLLATEAPKAEISMVEVFEKSKCDERDWLMTSDNITKVTGLCESETVLRKEAELPECRDSESELCAWLSKSVNICDEVGEGSPVKHQTMNTWLYQSQDLFD